MYFIFYFLFYVLCFILCRLYIGFLLSLILCCVLFLFVVFGDHWLYVIMIIIDLWLSFFLFYVFVLGYGYIILVIWGLLNYLYHRTGIYLFDFFFVCVFGDPNVCDYIILILWSLFFGWVYIIILEVWWALI